MKTLIVVAILLLVCSVFVACTKSTAPKEAEVVMGSVGCGEYWSGGWLCCRLTYTLENIGYKTAYNVRPWIKCSGKGQYLKTVEAIDPRVKLDVTTYISHCGCNEHKVFWD